MKRTVLGFALSLLSTTFASAQPAPFPAPVEADFVARDFAFNSGERMAEVKIHYRTVGTPRKDADGVVRNGVLILHGTGGTGSGFLGASYGGRLFGKGQPLDAEKYFIILPDNVGHGQSSKPSDGLRMKFPKYRYADMVKLQYELVTKGLGLTNLKLVMGTSMGAMHAWDWGYMYPGFAAGLVPLASNPVEIGGRNRVWRKFLIDAIETDPSWKNGDYTEQPRGLASAIGFLMMATSAPLQWQKQFPTIAAADKYVAEQVASRSKNTDANDMLYLLSRDRGLQPRAAPRQDQCAAARNQLRRRLRQPARAADDAGPDQAGEGRPVCPAADYRRNARSWHALAARHLGRRTTQVPGGPVDFRFQIEWISD